MRALALIVVVVGCGGPTNATTPSLIPAESARPVQLEFDLLSGGRWSSHDAAGRIVVIDTWATYCKPCKQSFPKLNRLMVEHPDVVVIGVSVDEDPAVGPRVPRGGAGVVHDRARPEAHDRTPTSRFLLRAFAGHSRSTGCMRLRAEDLKEADYDALPGWITALQ